MPDAIPHHFLNIQFQDDISLQDAIVHIRGTLVPYGYTPCPFKRDTPKSLPELLRSIAATHDFPHTMGNPAMRNLEQTSPNICMSWRSIPSKVVPHNEREEHNHVLKRIATCTRSGNNIDLHYEVFVEAMRV